MTNKHTQESYFTCSRSHIHKQRNSVSYPSSSEGCSKLLFPWQFSYGLLRGKKRSEHPMAHNRNNDTGTPARDGTQPSLHGLKVATPGSNANTQLVQPSKIRRLEVTGIPARLASSLKTLLGNENCQLRALVPKYGPQSSSSSSSW